MADPSQGLLAIPAYNEEASLGATLDEARAWWPAAHTVVVDDGSTDATREIAIARGVSCVSHPTNLGYGPALQTAMVYAAARGYPFVVFLDADGQHDPRLLAELVAPIRRDEAELVIGSRLVDGRPIPVGAGRRLAMLIFSILTIPILGRRIRDTSSGFKAVHGRVFGEIRDAQFVDFHSELLAFLAVRGYRIREIPAPMRPRRRGRSMHGWSSVFTYPLTTVLALIVGVIEGLRVRGTGWWLVVGGWWLVT